MDTDSSDGPCWYQNRQRKVSIDDSQVLRFLQRLSRGEAEGREFAVLVSSDEAVRRANRQFRGISKTTDVLSFPDGEDGRLGDLLISAGRALVQAERYGHSVEDELKILALHGLLHLLGHDHETDSGEMRTLEAKLRKSYKLPASLTERAEAC